MKTELGEIITTRVWERGEKLWQVSFLHVYAIMIMVGVIASFLACVYFWRRQRYSWETIQILLIIIVPTSIFGARFWYVLWENDWADFFKFEGLSIHGGVFFSAVSASIFLYFRRRTIDYKTAFSLILPNVILGQMLGRWGNFANHEVYGPIVSGSSLDWMGALKEHMLIRETNQNGITTVGYRAPFFLYEFITSGVGWTVLVLILLNKNWARPGVVGALYLVWYGAVRLVMEPLRTSVDIMGGKTGFPVSLFVAALSLGFGLYLAIYWQWLSQKARRFFGNKYDNFSKKYHNTQWSLIVKIRHTTLKVLKTIFNAQDYEKITPIKPRRQYLLWGPKSDNKRRFVFFGKEVPNKINIWIPREEEDGHWSKRDIKRGFRRKNTPVNNVSGPKADSDIV